VTQRTYLQYTHVPVRRSGGGSRIFSVGSEIFFLLCLVFVGLTIFYLGSGVFSPLDPHNTGQTKDIFLQHSKSTTGTATRRLVVVHSATTPPTTPSPTKSAGSQSWQQGFGQSQHSPRDAVNILPLPTQENISAAPPVPPDIKLVI
jgi:hypothetical protein